MACFPGLPSNSLLYRRDIEAGSKWGLREIESFKLLRQKRGPRFPVPFNGNFTEAKELVKTSQDIQAAVSLLDSN